LELKVKEYSKIWRNKEFQNIELLSASFKDFSYSKHWHDEFAIGLIQEGVEGLHFNGSKINIPKNNIVAINPGEVHTGFSVSNTGWIYRMFYFDPSIIKSILEEHSIHSETLLTNINITNPKIFRKLLDLHLSLEQEHFNLTRESLLVSSITELFAEYGSQKFNTKKYKKDFISNIQIKEYLFDNYASNISLDELSSLTDINKYQLIRNFKKEYNLTPHQYLNLIKINKSKEFLIKGLSITDAALTCGFFDQSHFTRYFKCYTGVTPNIYKNKLI